MVFYDTNRLDTGNVYLTMISLPKRQCSRCGKFLFLRYFNKGTHKGRLQPWCKACQRDYWYERKEVSKSC